MVKTHAEPGTVFVGRLDFWGLFVVVFFREFVPWDCGGGSAVTLGGAPGGLWCPPTSVFVSRLRITSRFQISIFVSKYRPCPAVNYWWGSGRHWNVYWPPSSSRTHSALVIYCKCYLYSLYNCIFMSCIKRECGALKCISRMRGQKICHWSPLSGADPMWTINPSIMWWSFQHPWFHCNGATSLFSLTWKGDWESNLEQPQWRSFRSEISGNSGVRPSWINPTSQPTNPTPGYCLPSIKLGL